MTRYLIRFEDGTASIVDADRVVSYEERAEQYLKDGAVHILYADRQHVTALCRGSSKFYSVTYDRKNGWSCTCRMDEDCPHRIAVRTVVAGIDDGEVPQEVQAELATVREQVVASVRNDPEFVALRQRGERVRELEAEVAGLRDRASRVLELQAELGEKTARLGRLEAEIAKSRQRAARMAQLEAELSNRASRISVLDAKLKELKGVQARAEQLQARVRELEHHIARLQPRVQDAEARRSDVEEELRSVRARAAQAGHLERQLAERDTWLQTLDAELSKLRQEALRAAQLQTSLEQQGVWVKELEARLAQQVSLVTRMKVELAERDIQIRQLETEVQGLRARVRPYGADSDDVAAAPRRAVRTSTEQGVWIDRALPDLAHGNGDQPAPERQQAEPAS